MIVCRDWEAVCCPNLAHDHGCMFFVCESVDLNTKSIFADATSHRIQHGGCIYRHGCERRQDVFATPRVARETVGFASMAQLTA